MKTVRARFDGQRFVPEEPVDLPVGSIVEISIPETQASAVPRQASGQASGTTAGERKPEEQPAAEKPAEADEKSGAEANERPLMKLLEMLDKLPVNPDLPEDFAEQHDHYLYGTPKRQ